MEAGGEMEEKLPPGFRFHPTDEELIIHYLMKKISDANFTGRAIADVDLNKCEPWDLPGKAKMGTKEWYFFSLRDRKYPTGVRTNRATNTGYWKTTGKDKEIYNTSVSSDLVGMKKTLVFYKGRAPRGEKTNWVMHEYRIHSKPALRATKDEWVVCRVFRKSGVGKKYPSSNHSRAANPYQMEMGSSTAISGMPSQIMPTTINEPCHHFPIARNYMGNEEELVELSRVFRASITNMPPPPAHSPMHHHYYHPLAGSGDTSLFTISGLNLNLGAATSAYPFSRQQPPPAAMLNQHQQDVSSSSMMTSAPPGHEAAAYGVDMNGANGAANRYMGMDHCVDLDTYWPSY